MSTQAEELKKFAEESGVIDREAAEQIEAAQRPTVIIPGGEISITQSANALFAHIAPTKRLFLRDGHVCKLVQKDGVQKLELLGSAEACSFFEKFVNFAKQVKGKDGIAVLKPEVISKETAEKYLAAEGKGQLPEVDGLLSCPLITERDKKIHIVQSGYDPVTKLLILKDVALHDVELAEAVETLQGLVQDFQFQTPSDRSRATASMITPALKFGGFIKGPIPADAAEADQSQAGKSYRQQMIAAIYNDTPAVVTKKEGSGVGSLEEAFATALVEGRPFIQFDNVRGKFNLQGLESFMTTTGTFAARPAYSRPIHVYPSKFMIMISSNGYQTTPDLSNRSSIIRIYKRPGYDFRAWERDGEHRGGMREFIEDNQAYILSCVFAVIREWHRLGKLRTTELRHDFRDWSQILDWIVQNIFGEAPLMDGHEAAQTRVSNKDHTFIQSVAVALAVRNRLNVPLKANEIFDVCSEGNITIDGLMNDKQNDREAASKTIGLLMSRVFGVSNSVTIDLFTVTREEKRERSGDNTFTTKCYTFTRAGGETQVAEGQ